MSVLAKANLYTKKSLGASRPVVIAAAAGYGVYTIGNKFEVGMMSDKYVAAGIGITVAAATEAILYFYGDTTAMETANKAEFTAKIANMTCEEFDALCTSLEAELGDAAQTVITNLKAARVTKRPNVQNQQTA
jgi:hypothetical protein